jgi:hypothetical protein
LIFIMMTATAANLQQSFSDQHACNVCGGFVQAQLNNVHVAARLLSAAVAIHVMYNRQARRRLVFANMMHACMVT